MTTESDAKGKVNHAIKKADEIQKHLHKAYESLNRRVNTNGYGIYHDIPEVKNLVFDTQAELNKALELLNNVDWPTDKDYDAAGM